MSPELTAAIWGLCGAVPYAGTRLATALWGSADIDVRMKKLAAANFVIAIFTGPALAAALTPSLMRQFHTDSLAAMAVTIGVFANAAWPILTDKRVMTPLISTFLERLGGWATGLSKSMDAPDDK